MSGKNAAIAAGQGVSEAEDEALLGPNLLAKRPIPTSAKNPINLWKLIFLHLEGITIDLAQDDRPGRCQTKLA